MDTRQQIIKYCISNPQRNHLQDQCHEMRNGVIIIIECTQTYTIIVIIIFNPVQECKLYYSNLSARGTYQQLTTNSIAMIELLHVGCIELHRILNSCSPTLNHRTTMGCLNTPALYTAIHIYWAFNYIIIYTSSAPQHAL